MYFLDYEIVQINSIMFSCIIMILLFCLKHWLTKFKNGIIVKSSFVFIPIIIVHPCALLYYYFDKVAFIGLKEKSKVVTRILIFGSAIYNLYSCVKSKSYAYIKISYDDYS